MSRALGLAVCALALAACDKVEEKAPVASSAAAKPAGVVDLDAPIDAETLRSSPPNGRVQDVPFVARHVTIHETVCDAAYQLTFFDKAPEAGGRLDGVESDRAITLTFPRATRDAPLQLTKSDPRWRTEPHLGIAYGSPLPGMPERVVRPGPGEAAIYLSLSAWEEAPGDADARGQRGRATGRISIRNSVSRGETGLWLEGQFEAALVEGPGCLPD